MTEDDRDLTRMDSYDVTTIEGVIEQLKDHRQTHINWARHFDAFPEEADERMGDAHFHHHVTKKYTQMIETISKLAGPQ